MIFNDEEEIIAKRHYSKLPKSLPNEKKKKCVLCAHWVKPASYGRDPNNYWCNYWYEYHHQKIPCEAWKTKQKQLQLWEE